MSETIVRSVHRSSGGLRVTIFYPARHSSLEEARETGLVPTIAGEPRPVVILLPGINVVADSYRWLAMELVQVGCVAATCSLIGSLGPAGEGITPGFDFGALTPETLGTRPSASALGEVLEIVRDDRHLADVVDMGRLVLGGHSAGGTLALHNARPDWFEGVCAAFSYAGHTMTATSIGCGGAVARIPSETPMLLLSGAVDGVIEASRGRYLSDPDAPHDPVRRTFDEAVTSERGDVWWVELVDGTHFTPCHPVDDTSARSFLEVPQQPSAAAAARSLLVRLLAAFLREYVLNEPSGERLRGLTAHPGISNWAFR